MKKIKIGTRNNRLTIRQAELVKQQLAELGVESELVIISTKADLHPQAGTNKIEDADLFTREIEDALLGGSIDMAVHSMKEMPAYQPKGLILAGVSQREDPADCLLICKEQVAEDQLFNLKESAVVGSSSAVRKVQLLDYRKDLRFAATGGNMTEDLERLRSSELDAILAANADLTLQESSLPDIEVVKLNPQELVPAPAQGVFTYQCCEEDIEMRRLLRRIHHPEISALTNVERKALQLINGDFNTPLGVYCEKDVMGHYHVWAAWANGEGQPVRRTRISQSTNFLLAEKVVDALRQ